MITDTIKEVHVRKDSIVVHFTTHWRAMCMRDKVDDFIKRLSPENGRIIMVAVGKQFDTETN